MINFEINQTDFKNAINTIMTTIKPPDKAAVSILTYLHIFVDKDIMTITSYDLDRGIIIPIHIDNFSGDTAKFLIEPKVLKTLFAHIKSADIINAEYDDNSKVLNLKCGNSNNRIKTGSVEYYPCIPDDVIYANSTNSNYKKFSIGSDTIKSIIKETNYAVSTNENKPIFTGELFDIKDDKLNLIATDECRMAINTELINSDDTYNFVVSGNFLDRITKLCKDKEIVTIVTTSKYAIFIFDNCTAFAKLIEGEFFNYNRAIPHNNDIEIEVDVKDVLNVIERFLPLCEMNKIKAPMPIRMTLEENAIRFTVKQPTIEIDDTVKIKYISGYKNGMDFITGYNCKFLCDVFKSIQSDKVKLGLTKPLSPMKIEPLDDCKSFLHLMLPIKIKD